MVYAITTLKLENFICKIFNLILCIKQIEPEELNFCFYCQTYLAEFLRTWHNFRMEIIGMIVKVP